MASIGENQTSSGKLCVAAALTLCVAHGLSIGLLAHRIPLVGDYFNLVNFSLWLSPVLVLLLFRRNCAVIGICAIPILVTLCGRMYFAWQFYTLGTNSMGQKGDWALWLATFMGMASVAVVLFWLLAYAAMYLANFEIRRSNRR